LFGYFDEERRLPEIETYVFIGENLHGEVRGSESQSWYFRNAETFPQRGFRQEHQDKGQIFAVGEGMIENFIGVADLLKELRKVARRNRSYLLKHRW
jgi:hypothetical protein